MEGAVRAAGGRDEPAGAQREERLHQPRENLARPGPAWRLGQAPLGTARCRQHRAGCGKGKLRQSRDQSSLRKLPAQSWAALGAAAGWQSPVPCSSSQPGTQEGSRLLRPLFIPFINFLEFPQSGGMAMGGMQLPHWEMMLPEREGETEAEKCRPPDL